MTAPVVHILPMTLIRRERILPVSGRVLVRKGQIVRVGDVIAEAKLPLPHLMLDIAHGLGMNIADLEQHLQCRVGQRVSEGDVIAGPVGWPKRLMRAPKPGRVVAIRNGKLWLELESQPIQILAGFPGIVDTLIPERGAIIEAVGALIQGVWGNGQAASGQLIQLLMRPEDILTPDRINEDHKGKVILGGFCNDTKVLDLASALPVNGLILSSISSRVLPDAKRMPYPILVLEGFGLLPINLTAFQILSKLINQEVAVNAAEYDPYHNIRPEIIIPQAATEKPFEPKAVSEFTLHKRVRIIRAPYQAHLGVITDMREGLEFFPSGIAATAADVRIENGKVITIPLANLEILE